MPWWEDAFPSPSSPGLTVDGLCQHLASFLCGTRMQGKLPCQLARLLQVAPKGQKGEKASWMSFLGESPPPKSFPFGVL